MTNVQIMAGTLTANKEERVVSGLLLPFGELGQTNLGRFSVEKGVFTLPEDVSVLNANLDHDHKRPVANTITLSETDQGIFGSWRVGKGADGDALLASAPTDSEARRKLSIEVDDVKIKGGKAVSGRIYGAAFVKAGAFPSAALLAALAEDTVDEPADPEEPLTTEEKTSEEFTDADGKSWVRTTTRTTVVDGTETTITSVETITEPEPAEPEEEEPEVATATVPSTLAASVSKNDKVDKATLLATIAGASRTQDSSLLAALADVKISGANSVGSGVVVPEYVGEVWSGRTFQRRIIPLVSSGTLTSLSQKGWRWTTAPEVSEWAGNKADVPSNSPKTEAVDFAITRFAGGWDIAREFFDFGETAVIDSFLKLAADSYAKKSDTKVLSDLLAGATKSTVGTTPDGVSAGMAKIVRGALRVITADALPSFAVVAPDVYEELLFTKKDDVLAYLSMALGLEDGSLESFKIVPHVGVTAGNVLVGAKEAAGAYELGGSPIRVNALDMARGGVDEALFGYIQTRIEYPTGLQLVTPNAA